MVLDFMAIEYIAPIGRKNFPFPVLAERLQGEGVCLTESVTDSSARFRWPDSERRDHWPEDAEISLTEAGLLLSIHSGTRQQRGRLVQNVSLIASEMISEDVNFEEL